MSVGFEAILQIVCDTAGASLDGQSKTLAELGLISDQQRNLFRTRLRQRLAAQGIVASSEDIPNAEDVTIWGLAQTIFRCMQLGLLASEPYSPRFAGRELNKAEPGFAVVRIFYATDRKRTGSSSPKDFFGSDRSPDAALSLGACEVSIPREGRHKMGALEKPSIWRLEFRQDPEKHVILRSVEPLGVSEYYREIAQRMAGFTRKDAFVFIHGYNVSFEDAARRTAQLAYDLAFPGAPILYSWPSSAELLAYSADENNVEWTTPHLQQFLTELPKQTGAEQIHLIAHSMGNRALARALVGIQDNASHGPLFQQVVLTAPDIDTDIFLQIADAIKGRGQRITLYASSKDRALRESQRRHRGPRAGESGDSIVLIDGIDTIDASKLKTDFLGHSYFGSNRSVISDLFILMQDGNPPERRPGMRMVPFKQRFYWQFAR